MFHCSTVWCATALASRFRQYCPHPSFPRLRDGERRAGERAEQAVCAQLGDGHCGQMPERDRAAGPLRALDLHCLQIWRSGDDLARIAPGPLEQDLEASSQAIRVEDFLLPLD